MSELNQFFLWNSLAIVTLVRKWGVQMQLFTSWHPLATQKPKWRMFMSRSMLSDLSTLFVADQAIMVKVWTVLGLLAALTYNYIGFYRNFYLSLREKGNSNRDGHWYANGTDQQHELFQVARYWWWWCLQNNTFSWSHYYWRRYWSSNGTFNCHFYCIRRYSMLSYMSYINVLVSQFVWDIFKAYV